MGKLECSENGEVICNAKNLDLVRSRTPNLKRIVSVEQLEYIDGFYKRCEQVFQSGKVSEDDDDPCCRYHYELMERARKLCVRYTKPNANADAKRSLEIVSNVTKAVARLKLAAIVPQLKKKLKGQYEMSVLGKKNPYASASDNLKIDCWGDVHESVLGSDLKRFLTVALFLGKHVPVSKAFDKKPASLCALGDFVAKKLQETTFRYNKCLANFMRYIFWNNQITTPYVARRGTEIQWMVELFRCSFSFEITDEDGKSNVANILLRAFGHSISKMHFDAGNMLACSASFLQVVIYLLRHANSFAFCDEWVTSALGKRLYSKQTLAPSLQILIKGVRGELQVQDPSRLKIISECLSTMFIDKSFTKWKVGDATCDCKDELNEFISAGKQREQPPFLPHENTISTIKSVLKALGESNHPGDIMDHYVTTYGYSSIECSNESCFFPFWQQCAAKSKLCDAVENAFPQTERENQAINMDELGRISCKLGEIDNLASACSSLRAVLEQRCKALEDRQFGKDDRNIDMRQHEHRLERLNKATRRLSNLKPKEFKKFKEAWHKYGGIDNSTIAIDNGADGSSVSNGLAEEAFKTELEGRLELVPQCDRYVQKPFAYTTHIYLVHLHLPQIPN